jgi:hypothetical protein
MGGEEMHGRPRSLARRAAGLLAAGLLLASASGCTGIRTVESRDGAFIYGFIDVPEDVGWANCVGIIQAEKTAAGIGYRNGCMATSGEGLFFIQNVPPMRYTIHGFTIERNHHNLGPLAKPFAVQAGSMHYVGTFKYRLISEPGILKAGRFTLTPASRPTHAEVLRKLLGQELVDARWKRRIQARLRELGAAD